MHKRITVQIREHTRLLEKESSSSSKSKSSSSKSSSSKSSSSKSSSSKSSSSKSSSSKSSSSKSSSKSGASAGLETTALNEITESVDARLELIPAPYGPGRIVQLTGYHYHNPDDANDPARGPEYLRRTILSNLKHGAVDLPISLERQRADESGVETVSFKDMGIYYPVLVNPGVIDDKFRLLDPQAAAEARKKLLESMIKQSGAAGGMRGGMNGGGMGAGMTGGGMGAGMTGGAMGGGMSGGSASGGMGASGGRGSMGGDSMNNQIANALGSDKVLNLRRYDFTIQFVWIETKPTTRDERRKAAEEAAKAAEEAESGASTDDEETTTEPPATEPASTETTEAPATEPTATETTEAPATEPTATETTEAPATEPASTETTEAPAEEPAA